MKGQSLGKRISKKYRVRLADKPSDILAAQKLRHLAFGLRAPSGLDVDEFDPVCAHVLLEECKTNRLVCCYRLLHLNGGSEIEKSYSAQHYELSALHSYSGKLVEMGRFCIHPEVKDPDVLRLAWGALAKYVDKEGVELLFGCASFQGTDATAYLDAFAVLRDKYLAPKRWLPRVKAPRVFRFAARLRRKPDMRQALRKMPPLLRSYLMMGGWVSDHAVVDSQMNTLHVFTGIEIGSIPAVRKRLLQALS
ncbi:GNAT family N-acetyltransferase [Rhodobacteraceae bacterium]|nr:GNAT family N-acetyltransferase [Paracoccaceae bacterium]